MSDYGRALGGQFFTANGSSWHKVGERGSASEQLWLKASAGEREKLSQDLETSFDSAIFRLRGTEVNRYGPSLNTARIVRHGTDSEFDFSRARSGEMLGMPFREIRAKTAKCGLGLVPVLNLESDLYVQPIRLPIAAERSEDAVRLVKPLDKLKQSGSVKQFGYGADQVWESL